MRSRCSKSDLMTEINDFGYPQNSEIDTLKTYITTESIVSTSIAAVRCRCNEQATVLLSLLGRVIKDHHASDRYYQLETCRCQIQEERGLRGCDRGCQFEHECQRCAYIAKTIEKLLTNSRQHIARRCRRSHSNASLPIWYT